MVYLSHDVHVSNNLIKGQTMLENHQIQIHNFILVINLLVVAHCATQLNEYKES